MSMTYVFISIFYNSMSAQGLSSGGHNFMFNMRSRRRVYNSHTYSFAVRRKFSLAEVVLSHLQLLVSTFSIKSKKYGHEKVEVLVSCLEKLKKQAGKCWGRGRRIAAQYILVSHSYHGVKSSETGKFSSQHWNDIQLKVTILVFH